MTTLTVETRGRKSEAERDVHKNPSTREKTWAYNVDIFPQVFDSMNSFLDPNHEYRLTGETHEKFRYPIPYAE